MIRTGIATWLAVLGAAGAICLPMATGVSELTPRRMAAGSGYPVRIVLPEVGPTVALALAQDSASMVEAEAVDELPSDAADPALAALGDAANLAEAQSGPRPADSKARGDVFLNLDFDLADPSTASTADAATADVEVAKSVRVNGTDLGQATIRVTPGATVLIARDEVVALLEAAGQENLAAIMTGASSPDGFVSFEEMRRRGLNIRYDAADDHISLSS